MTKRLLALMGPTASGKTGVALELTKYLPVEILACDSMQVYHSMPILTQSPADTHLAGFLEPSQEYSADQYRKDALTVISQIFERKKIPFLVGGTGLYLRALLDGLFEAPQGGPMKDQSLRDKWYREAEEKGPEFLHKKLEKIDPLSARKIHFNDLRRTIRALEVFELTGRSMSEQKANRKGLRAELACSVFVLERDRKDLYKRIDNRVDQMIKEGLVEEVETLCKMNLSQTAQGALGIKEIKSFLSGDSSLEEATELLKKNTRHYAKRQMSWFRHEKEARVVCVEPKESPQDTASKLFKMVQSVA